MPPPPDQGGRVPMTMNTSGQIFTEKCSPDYCYELQLGINPTFNIYLLYIMCSKGVGKIKLMPI